MEDISEFYLELLKEFYNANAGISGQNKSESNNSTSEKKELGGALERGLLDAVYQQEDKIRSVFEKVIYEIRNIEYAISYYIDISEKNQQTKFSQIETNASMHINFDSPVTIPKNKTKLPVA